MSVLPFHLIEPAMRALGADALSHEGLQLLNAAALRDQHHPPLNPDWPALLFLATDTRDDARDDARDAAPDFGDLARVLRNGYPAHHPLTLLAPGAESSPDSVSFSLTLDALAATPPESLTGAWSVLYLPPLAQAGSFERFQETIAHLRAPEGCPWDQKQTHTSLRPYLIEETYEVIDALDRGDRDALREELGDLLLQIVLHSQIAVDEGAFNMADVIAHINAKIIHRHPHVWGDVQVSDENDVKANWDRLKQAEKSGNGAKKPRASRLDGVPQSMPALSQAFSYQDRAARVKFDWPTIEPVIDKIREELAEVLSAPDAAAREGEIGDLLFAVVNLARWHEIDPEAALRGTNGRFYRRFHYIEQQASAQGRPVDALSLDEMDALWEAAKRSGL